MALSRLVFMPFGYLVDKYRWDLYSGWADESNMNCHWVKLRMDIQGNYMYILITTGQSRGNEIFSFQVLLHQTFEPRKTLTLAANTMWLATWDT